jgi:hypothetical protein
VPGPLSSVKNFELAYRSAVKKHSIGVGGLLPVGDQAPVGSVVPSIV